MELTIYVNDHEAERLAALLEAVNKRAAERNRRSDRSLDDIAFLAIVNGIDVMEQRYTSATVDTCVNPLT